MPQFSYRAKKRSGEVVEGILEADTRRIVISKLQSMQYFPISVEEKSQKKSLKAHFKMGFGRVSNKDTTDFTRQVSDLLRAGLPLVRALEVIEKQTANEKFLAIIGQMRADVQGGSTFSDALRKHPRVFSELYTSMVRSGEVGGMLDAVLERLADFAETERETKSKIISAMAYPALMIIVGIVVIFILLTFVIPRFVSMFEDIGQTLPLSTRSLVALSTMIKGYWWVGLIAFISGIFAYRHYVKNEEGRINIDRFKLKIPFVGELITKREISKFARTLGTLLTNGVPILKALSITENVISNKVLSKEISDVKENIKEGEKLSQRLGEWGLFPPVAVNMIAVGEETGELENTLIRLADTFERETDRLIRTITTLVEPMMILLMAILVGYIVMSMILPIFEISSSIQ